MNFALRKLVFLKAMESISTYINTSYIKVKQKLTRFWPWNLRLTIKRCDRTKIHWLKRNTPFVLYLFDVKLHLGSFRQNCQNHFNPKVKFWFFTFKTCSGMHLKNGCAPFGGFLALCSSSCWQPLCSACFCFRCNLMRPIMSGPCSLIFMWSSD